MIYKFWLDVDERQQLPDFECEDTDFDDALDKAIDNLRYYLDLNGTRTTLYCQVGSTWTKVELHRGPWYVRARSLM